MDDDRPQTDWEARVAKAKRDGTWGTDDEEPSPYPPAERRKRFWLAFGSPWPPCWSSAPCCTWSWADRVRRSRPATFSTG